MKKLTLLFAIFLLMAASSCKTIKEVPYMVNADSIPQAALTLNPVYPETVLSPGDMVNIEVMGSSLAAFAPFNKGMIVQPDGTITSMRSSIQGGMSGSYMMNQNGQNGQNGMELSTFYYLIDQAGDIQFPILGTIHAAGMTTRSLGQYLVNEIYPKYTTEKPVIDVRLMNFKYTTLGAIQPGVHYNSSERLNILEAIAKLGDLNLMGKRTNIMLIRTNHDGTREVRRFNIHDKDILLSPYFYLQPNDIIYVEPNDSMKEGAWRLSSVFGTVGTVIGSVSGVIAFGLSIINLTKK